MKKRYEYPTNTGVAIDAVEAQKKVHGGRLALCYTPNSFGDGMWLEKIYWYSHHYTQTDIFADLPGYGKVEIR